MKYEIPEMEIMEFEYVRVTEVSGGDMTGGSGIIEDGTGESGGSSNW